MTTELGIALLLLLGVIIYVAGKVLGYMRQSQAEWERVDKSKLKKWDDEDD